MSRPLFVDKEICDFREVAPSWTEWKNEVTSIYTQTKIRVFGISNIKSIIGGMPHPQYLFPSTMIR